MLSKLFIKNYALIDDLEMEFGSGFNMITGETGAGKSILLGALGLILGNRADLSSLKAGAKKCVIEATFSLKQAGFEGLFESLDLDFEEETIIRREILPSGKSRGFVNDSPVTLGVLTQLKPLIIDIHSQHQTLDLGSQDFQYDLLDLLSGHQKELTSYRDGLKTLRRSERELNQLLKGQSELEQQKEYNAFLLQELEALKLEDLDIEELEKQQEILSNSEDLQESLSQGIGFAETEGHGISSNLVQMKSVLSSLISFGGAYKELYERLSSVQIEFEDLLMELHGLYEKTESNPEELERINGVLSSVFDLKKKHGVLTVEALIEVREHLSIKNDQVHNFERDLGQLQNSIDKTTKQLNSLSKKLTANRIKVIPSLKKQLETILGELGMNNAEFFIELQEQDDFHKYGKDQLSFLFQANKGGQAGELKKVASGGELSRIMLGVKQVLADYQALPTLVFDEIDTGVSGEIALKMGMIMKQMSSRVQVITISHLPQVAALGNRHFKVFKEDLDDRTQTFVKVLDQEQRIEELAEMLGGKSYSESAINHAKELLLD
ncbi:MAG: DNA repair protein RecN [Flavobacteriaceae bacterium]